MIKPSVRQLLVYGVLGLLVLMVSMGWLLGTRWGQQQLEQLIRRRLAQQSDLVLAPFRVDISVLRNFPHLTASVYHLSLTDTSHQQPVPVLRVGQADIQLELSRLWRGEFRVSHLTLRNGQFRQFTDSLGRDWGLRGKGPRRPTPTAPPNFHLDSLVLLNVRVTDRNDLQHSGFSAQVDRGRLTVRTAGGVGHLVGRLDGQLEYLRSGRGNLFTQKPVVALVRYQYNFRRRQGTFQRTKALLNGDTVLISGTHRGAAPGEPRGTHLNLRFWGTQPLLDVLHVALPTSLNRFLAGATSPSHAQIRYAIRGLSGPTTRPRTVLRFVLRNAQVQWADSVRRIRRWDARGVFDNGPSHAARTTSLRFEQCRLYSAAGELDATLAVRDFTHPRLRGRVRGRTELQTLAAVVAPGLWRAQAGQAALDLELNGALPEIPDRRARRNRRPNSQLPPIAARGFVRLENAAFTIPSRGARMRQLNVRVLLHDSIWQLVNLTGRLNNMRVQANATTSYLLAYFSGQRPSTSITGTFAVDELRLAELRPLLAAPRRPARPNPRPGAPGPKLPAVLAARALNLLPPGLRLNIGLRCGRLLLSSDTLQQLAATVRHNGQQVQLRDLRADVWGGQLRGALRWATDTLNPQPVAVRLSVHFPVLNYTQLLTRISRPARRPAAAPSDPTLREVLLTANGQATVTIDQLLLPGGTSYLRQLRLRINKTGPNFQIPTFSFLTSAGGQGQISARARLHGTHLAQAHADLSLRYATLDVQHLLQLLAALSSVPAAPSAGYQRTLRPAPATSPLLDGTLTGRVRVAARQMRYGALRGQQFQLESSLVAGQARVDACSMQVLGGRLALRGTLGTDGTGFHHPLRAQLQLQHIALPELFGLARTLGFDVLGPENIRGTVRCEADVHTDLDHTFLPRLAQTQAFLRTDIRNLELVEVEALMQALKVLSEKRTRHLYFEPLSPRFVLDGGRVLIPGLGLSSNLTDMTVSGEYHLDGRANLYVGLSPLQALLGNNKTRIERIQSGEATQRRSRGLVYVNLRRTPGSHYQVRLFQKQEQRRQQALLEQEYQRLLHQPPLDTTLHLLR